MDIYVKNVPPRVNRAEFRIFLRDKLRVFDILAYDVEKYVGQNYAFITVAVYKNGERFLDRHGTHERLAFKSATLTCSVSTRKDQPDPLKVLSLLEKESQIKSKSLITPTVPISGSPPSIFPIQNLMTGIWSYDHLGKLVFDQRLKDVRSGYINFGKHALMIYLEPSAHHNLHWHCRIDIPYAILEHTITSSENGQRGSITLTLKSPPKLYEIVDKQDLHLYAGQSANTNLKQVSCFAGMSLTTSKRNRPAHRLERLCALSHAHSKNTALCMVYKLQVRDLQLVSQATKLLEKTVSEVYTWKTMVPYYPTSSIEDELGMLEGQLSRSKLEFAVQFQMLALVFEGTVTPVMMTGLIPCIVSMAKQYGQESAASAVRYLGRRLPTPAPRVDSSIFDLSAMKSQLQQGVEDARGAEKYGPGNKREKELGHNVLIYKATITPTGIILRGPQWDTSNRILRKYSRYTEYFMRVSFTDEDGLSVFHDQNASQQKVYSRFRKVLKDGITIADRQYAFLGFSHSSLRSHQVWFMAPFTQDGVPVCARAVIRDLGDFTSIHCAAKCAARIGQAFSDTDLAIRIPDTAEVIENMADVTRNGRNFSDGCGTISQELLEMVWRALRLRQRLARPTVLQMRFRGVKGILSLDSSLSGQKLHARSSMTKYVAGAGWRDLELCGTACKPLRVFLNHQFIKILEDRGVPLENFVALQNDACSMLEEILKNPNSTAGFLRWSNSTTSARLPRLFELMQTIGLSFEADRFLCEIVKIAVMSEIRDMKYRARIPVKDGFQLYGTMDETNTLREGEVYIVTEEETESGRRERRALVRDRVVIARTPALHPGDMQVVKAVDVPAESPLRKHHNCIFFSQQGARDLPSQLGGGDLDGDLYYVFYDSRLMPTSAHEPADYAPVRPRNLGRPVQVNDIANFFIDFMINDKLGRISTRHKVLADQKERGTLDSGCITLAKLGSDAVDFSKSGVPVDEAGMPPGKYYIRPDFMAPGPECIINDLGKIDLQEPEVNDIDEPDSLSVLDPDKARYRYYRSEKALGHLYRNIDEWKFLDRMRGAFVAAEQGSGGESLMQKLERYIDRETPNIQWQHHIPFAENVREYYEDNMLDIMDTLRIHRGKPLTELEVVSGNILGHKQRASNRYIYEANIEVQSRYGRDHDGIVYDIVHGDGDGDDKSEALPRAIACFKVALRTEGWECRKAIQSWKYVAARVCLEQLCEFRVGSLRPF